MSLCLTAEEVRQLTGKTRRPAQVRALRLMGIDHRVRPDGSPAVLRSAVETTSSTRLDSANEPNWRAL
ncbi:MAG: DUF4224 domain-containing protein [Nitrococcus mobilis]|nr:DUF4224 domain-containing protein [Nitrococcus mobilis]